MLLTISSCSFHGDSSSCREQSFAHSYMPAPQPLSVHYGLWTPEQSCPCNIKDRFHPCGAIQPSCTHMVQFSQAVHATSKSSGSEGINRRQMLPAAWYLLVPTNTSCSSACVIGCLQFARCCGAIKQEVQWSTCNQAQD